MKFTTEAVTQGVMILANDHFVSIPYDCSNLPTNEKGIIPAGTIVPANDATAEGVLLNDVVPDENPNGAIVIHGFIDTSKLPEAPTVGISTIPEFVEEEEGKGETTTVQLGAVDVLKQITFI